MHARKSVVVTDIERRVFQMSAIQENHSLSEENCSSVVLQNIPLVMVLRESTASARRYLASPRSSRSRYRIH